MSNIPVNVKGTSFLLQVVLQELSVRPQNASLPENRVFVSACVEMVGTPFHATRSGQVVDTKGSRLGRTRAATPTGLEIVAVVVWVVLSMTAAQKLTWTARLVGVVAAE